MNQILETARKLAKQPDCNHDNGEHGDGLAELVACRERTMVQAIAKELTDTKKKVIEELDRKRLELCKCGTWAIGNGCEKCDIFKKVLSSFM